MRFGFTLIELLISIFLSSMIAIVLYTSFFSLNRSTRSVEDRIEQDLRISLLQNQLERDIAGIFAPYAATLSEKEQKSTTELKKTDTSATPIKPLKHLFLSKNQQQSLSSLTFITNNPMRVYEYAPNTKVKPFIARVVYTLTPERGTQGFTLMRQESDQLELEPFEKAGTIRSYELVTHIKQIKTEFGYTIIEKQKEKMPEKPGASKEKPKEEKPKIEYATELEWVEKEKANKKRPLIPEFIILDIRLWNNDYSQEIPIVLRFEVPSYQSIVSPADSASTDVASTPTATDMKATPTVQQAEKKPGQK